MGTMRTIVQVSLRQLVIVPGIVMIQEFLEHNKSRNLFCRFPEGQWYIHDNLTPCALYVFVGSAIIDLTAKPEQIILQENGCAVTKSNKNAVIQICHEYDMLVTQFHNLMGQIPCTELTNLKNKGPDSRGGIKPHLYEYICRVAKLLESKVPRIQRSKDTIVSAINILKEADVSTDVVHLSCAYDNLVRCVMGNCHVDENRANEALASTNFLAKAACEEINKQHVALLGETEELGYFGKRFRTDWLAYHDYNVDQAALVIVKVQEADRMKCIFCADYLFRIKDGRRVVRLRVCQNDACTSRICCSVCAYRLTGDRCVVCRTFLQIPTSVSNEKLFEFVISNAM